MNPEQNTETNSRPKLFDNIGNRTICILIILFIGFMTFFDGWSDVNQPMGGLTGIGSAFYAIIFTPFALLAYWILKVVYWFLSKIGQ